MLYFWIFVVDSLLAFCDFIGLELLALKSADSSSVHKSGNYNPDKAIDNDIENTFHSLTSPADMNPWLQIELEYVANVDHVIIHNRKDCCGKRMKNVALRVGLTKFTKGMELQNDETCAIYDGPGSDGEKIIISCSREMKGQYVSIHRMENTPAILNLNEIMIYGHVGK